jgi:hypothetical protein
MTQNAVCKGCGYTEAARYEAVSMLSNGVNVFKHGPVVYCSTCGRGEADNGIVAYWLTSSERKHKSVSAWIGA